MLIGWVIVELEWSSTIEINTNVLLRSSLDLKLLYENITTIWIPGDKI